MDFDPIRLILACEKITSECREKSFVLRLLEADMRGWWVDCLGAYPEILRGRKFTPYVLPKVEKNCLNLRLERVPSNLPQGPLPLYLGGLEWYRAEAVLVPVFGVLMFSLIVVQSTLVSVFVP